MSTLLRIALWLSGFLLVAGLVYGVTSHELTGAPLLLVAAATFTYLGLASRSAIRKAVRAGEGASGEAEEPPHVPPTIWPLAFSIAALAIAIGVVVSRWILAAGIALFAVSAGGWFRDIARQHRTDHDA